MDRAPAWATSCFASQWRQRLKQSEKRLLSRIKSVLGISKAFQNVTEAHSKAAICLLLLRCKSLKLKENKKKRIACHSPSDTSQTFVGRLPPHQSSDTHALRSLSLLRFQYLLGRLTNDLAAFHVLPIFVC